MSNRGRGRRERWRLGAGILLATAALCATLCFPRPSNAQGLFARADANCNYLVNAADVVASMRALDGEGVCSNADCDRDGAVTGADIDCAARCLFGECPVPPHAPAISAVAPELGEGISPFTTVRITGANFDPDEQLTRVTIGGVLAEVVEVISPQEILVVVPALPPGPAEVKVQAGEVVGIASPIEIVAQSPMGDPDTLESTFALMQSAAERLATLDLESAFGDDTEIVLEALQTFSQDVAVQRAALATDPALTPALRAQLDAAFDSSGVPEELRAVIAEIDALLLAGAALHPDQGEAAGAVGAATLARRVAKTLAVARGVAAAAGAGASIPASAVAVGTAVLVGAITLGGSAALPPIITSQTFFDRTGAESGRIKSDGSVLIRGHRLIGTNLVIRTALGEVIVIEPEETGDDFRRFRLSPTFGFCEFARLSLRRSLPLLGESQRIVWGVSPELVSLYRTTRVEVGNKLLMETIGVAGCESYARFYGPNAGPFDFTSSARLTAENSRTVVAVVPSVPTDDYMVRAFVNVEETEAFGVQVFNPLNRVIVRCSVIQLKQSPAAPDRTICTATLSPSGIPTPARSRLVWASSDEGTATIEGGGSQVTVIGRHPGTTRISAALKLGDRVIADTEEPHRILVSDVSAPIVVLLAPGEGDVRPGASLPMLVQADDNEVVSRIILRATGDAAVTPVQEFPCVALDNSCNAELTVTLKEMDFTNPQVTITAEAVDGVGNVGFSMSRTYTVKQPEDTECPLARITSPPAAGNVNAGETVQVVAHADDDREDDTGVERFRYSATGDALAAPVSLELPFPTALPNADLRFNFTVKTAAQLMGVTDRSIVISVEAIDDKGNTCGAVVSVVSVIGTLDLCEGSITTDNPSGFIDEAFTITVRIMGDVANQIARVTSINPGGQFDLTPQGGGVYTVTLFYQGRGSFVLSFSAFDADGEVRCSGEIGLEALGPAPE